MSSRRNIIFLLLSGILLLLKYLGFGRSVQQSNTTDTTDTSDGESDRDSEDSQGEAEQETSDTSEDDPNQGLPPRAGSNPGGGSRFSR